MKIEDYAPLGNKTKSLFVTNYDGVSVFDNTFADPFRETIWEPQIQAAAEVEMTFGKKMLDQGYTKDRNTCMDAEVPLLNELRYTIKRCKKIGSITDSLKSFYISPLIKSISNKRIKPFQTNFEIMITAVNITANKAALIAKGFTQAKIDKLIDNHDNARDIQINKLDLEQKITDLSEDNQLILNTFMNTNQDVIDVLFAFAKSTNDKKLAKQATKKALLSSIRPIPEPQPRNRKIKKLSSIVLYSKFATKNALLLTRLTDVPVYLFRTESKTDPYVEGIGIELTLKNPREYYKNQIPGSGNFIKLHNPSNSKTALVSVFKIVITN